MKYLDNLDFLKEKNQAFIHTIRNEVDTFFENFKDDPSRTSRWGHHYFCQADGGLLIYDDQKPTEHICSICGRTYSNDLLNGVWVYMYRNQGAINAWKSALLYRITKQVKYLKNIKKFTEFYSDHYLEFKLHNKEGSEFKTLDEMTWGCSRIMPQSLNESIFIIRLLNGLEMVKEDLDHMWLKQVEQNLFIPAFEMFKPQVNKVHNISCWLNSAIGVMGLFMNNQAMIDFTFDATYNINKQLVEGVTKDYFWYEGSIHYNFFTLEGVINLLLFSKLYDYDFEVGYGMVESMLKQAYNYAFDSHQLPNPNDGWPNINLKSYSYIYAVGSKVYSEDSIIGRILSSILNKEGSRNEFPLSKPYYYLNDVSLEEFIFCPKARDGHEIIHTDAIHFDTSYCGLIKNDRINMFYKYGHNGPSHAHPDKMNIEVVIDGISMSRDLSNSGYGNVLCNEWHRVSASHNTVVANGENHVSVDKGIAHKVAETSFDVEAKGVYENVDYRRYVNLSHDGFVDTFEVRGPQGNYDYFFHVEGNLTSKIDTIEASMGYTSNGYQHLRNTKEVTQEDYISLEWNISGKKVTSEISLENKTLYIADTPDNPVTGYRKTMIIRSKEENPIFKLIWKLGV